MAPSWANDFSYRYFKIILQAIKARLELRLLGAGVNDAAQRSQLFLRHDVDVSLTRALAMAEIEYLHEVRATYMVLPNSRLYDLQTDSARRILCQLIEMGHEVGLHFNVDDDRRSKNAGLAEVEAEINDACRRLESITHQPVRAVSFHRPMQSSLRGPKMICGRINAYSEILMACYMSDSKGQWRNGEPLPMLQAVESPVVQLLIHPIWWGHEHMTPGERLQEFFDTETRGLPAAAAAAFDDNLARTLPNVCRKEDAGVKEPE